MDIVSLIKDYIIFKPKTKEELQEAVNLWCLKNSFHEEVPNIYRKITLSDTSLKKLNRYGNISLWDTSLITDMRELFSEQVGFNDNINNWDVSSVTDMSRMFYKAELFNQPLNSWDVSSVTNMKWMLSGAKSFDKRNALWYDFQIKLY